MDDDMERMEVCHPGFEAAETHEVLRDGEAGGAKEGTTTLLPTSPTSQADVSLETVELSSKYLKDRYLIHSLFQLIRALNYLLIYYVSIGPLHPGVLVTFPLVQEHLFGPVPGLERAGPDRLCQAAPPHHAPPPARV